MTDDYSRRLEAAKRASTLQLLFRTARLANERSIERFRRETGRELRAAHTTLLPHIDLDGTNQTELARRVGISKQAVGQLVRELEASGAVVRERDPADGRAWLVRFSEEGRAGLLEGLAVLRREEEALGEALGAEAMAALRHGLLALIDVLEPVGGPGADG